ncbi:hypothetical protein A5888_002376 [Enterococcus sp. 9E7_DIV0242]|uniref:Uncharacterized protein n=1 Tax=Candidatus Enterococcus clewellii TaxID=1834193 RepID=A0A242K4A0_9ENTE|nr:hypothetical protein A5888_002462 [Enterococcus sp. 9E7_DIV0242]
MKMSKQKETLESVSKISVLLYQDILVVHVLTGLVMTGYGRRQPFFSSGTEHKEAD